MIKEAVSAVNTGKKKKIVEGVQYKLLSLLCFVLIIGFWCVASYGHLVQEVFLPSPTAVISKLFAMAADGSLSSSEIKQINASVLFIAFSLSV